MSSQSTQTSPSSPSTAANKPRRRWVKVDVSEETFDHLHLVAAQSRMRIQPYLRRFLSEARPYESHESEGMLSFSREYHSENVANVTEHETQ